MQEKPLHLCYVGDGRNYHVKKWLPALVRAGLDVSLISFDLPDEHLPGVRSFRLGRPLRPHASKPLYVDYLLPARRISRLLSDIDCDVLMGSYATHYGWMAARTGFTPFVLQTWTGDLTVYPFRGPKRLFFGPVVRYSLKRAALITTDGRALLAQGKDLFPEVADKMVATRWGIDTGIGEGALARSKTPFSTSHQIANLHTYVVATSPRGLQHWYQPDLLLGSFLAALDEMETLFVIVLTLGHERSDVTSSLLDQVAAHPRGLVIDEFLSTDRMTDLWRATDIVVSVPHADGVSESVLEAVHAGAIPVLSNIPSNMSLVEDGLAATLVEPEQRPIIDAIRRISVLPEAEAKLLRLHNNAWVVDNASVDQTASQLVQEIRQLAVQSPS